MFNMKRGAILALVIVILLVFVPGVVQAAAETPPEPNYGSLLVALSFGVVIVVGGAVAYFNIRKSGVAKGLVSTFSYINHNKRLLDDSEEVLKYLPPEAIEKLLSILDTVALLSGSVDVRAAVVQIKKFIVMTSDGLPNEPDS